VSIPVRFLTNSYQGRQFLKDYKATSEKSIIMLQFPQPLDKKEASGQKLTFPSNATFGQIRKKVANLQKVPDYCIEMAL
jgi:hypothetical protein